ncbi:MAG: hypothetical protein WCL06_01150 [Bacteroidota bacterium]
MKKYVVRLNKHWVGNVSVEKTLTNGPKAIKIITSENDCVSKEIAINKIRQKLEKIDFSVNEVYLRNIKVSSLDELVNLLNQEN